MFSEALKAVIGHKGRVPVLVPRALVDIRDLHATMENEKVRCVDEVKHIKIGWENCQNRRRATLLRCFR